MRILLGDDHAVVRQGLMKILSEEFRDATFGEAATGTEVLDLASSRPWDVILLDVSMPEKSGLDVLRDLRARGSSCPVLVLSVHADAWYALRAYKTGAAGYLTKQSASEELVRAVRKILTGRKYITPALAEGLAAGLGANASERPAHELLTGRERQVMGLIASGMALNEIGRELALSPKTVSTYRARLLEKLQMKTNVELTLYVFQNGLLGQSPAWPAHGTPVAE